MPSKQCWNCHGTGREDDHSQPIPYKGAPTPKKMCSICAGTGSVPDTSSAGGGGDGGGTGGCMVLIAAGIGVVGAAMGLVKIFT